MCKTNIVLLSKVGGQYVGYDEAQSLGYFPHQTLYTPSFSLLSSNDSNVPQSEWLGVMVIINQCDGSICRKLNRSVCA